MEEIQKSLDGLAAKLDTKASKAQIDAMMEVLDLMRQTLDGVIDRMENQETRQVTQDLKMEEFRPEVRVFGEGIQSNRGRIEKLEKKSA